VTWHGGETINLYDQQGGALTCWTFTGLSTKDTGAAMSYIRDEVNERFPICEKCGVRFSRELDLRCVHMDDRR